ncbi:MAG TPA: sigma-70 family RNA polymerase sigma factor [Gaiellaceae bacterium]
MVAVPSIGRASEVTPRRAAPEADATRDLYERYARQIYSYCLHQLGNREEAEDATQSTFLNAFRGFKRGIDPEFESAWLYKIAQNVCLTRQRSSSRRRKVETPGDLEAMQDYVPAHQADSDELIRLPEALDAMPEQQRRALLLREWQGLSYKEIGEELDLSQAAVETLLFRARRSLAAGLSEEPVKKSAGIARRLGASDLGSVLSIVKSVVLTGGIKVATAVATVAATSVVAATPVTRHAVEDIVTPRPDKTPVHQVSAKSVARTRATTRIGAPFSLVSSRPTAAPAGRSAPLTAAAAKVRRHRLALHASNSTAGAGLMVGHAPSTTEPSAAISAPTAPVPTVDTTAPTPAAQPTAPAPVETPAPQQPAATQPAAAQPAAAQPVADKPKKDDSHSGQGTGGGGTTPAAAQPAAAQPVAVVTPATPAVKSKGNSADAPGATKASDRSLSSKGDDKKNNDKKNGGNKDTKSVLMLTQSPTVTTTAPTVTATTTTTPTTTTTTTTTVAATPPPPKQPTTTTTSTTTTAATPTQPTQSNRPAEGHKPDGKGDNGGNNNGNGKRK